MTNIQLNRIRLNLQAIIDCLEHIVENEKMQISTEINPNGFLGKAMVEKHSRNISLAKECQECLQFILDAMPRFIAEYKEMTPIGFQIRRFKSIFDLQKYRTEMKKVHECLDFYTWVEKITPNKSNEGTALSEECLNKLKQANAAMYKIKQ